MRGSHKLMLCKHCSLLKAKRKGVCGMEQHWNPTGQTPGELPITQSLWKGLYWVLGFPMLLSHPKYNTMSEFGLNSKKQKQKNPPKKTPNNPQIVQGLTELRWASFWWQPLLSEHLQNWVLYSIASTAIPDDQSLSFASLRMLQSAQLSWHIHLSLSWLRFSSRSCLGCNRWSSSWHQPIYHWPPERIKGYFP